MEIEASGDSGPAGYAARPVGRAISKGLDWCYPATCVLCGAKGQGELDLCAGCLRDLPGLGPSCPRCALPLPAAIRQDVLCGHCQRKPPTYDQCLALLRYQGLVPWLIGELKFRRRLSLARLFGQLLAQRMAALPEPDRPSRLLPVPLHAARLRERGFNQSLEIARVLGRRLGIPVDARSLVRSVATPPQVSLARQARLVNVRDAFRLRRPLSDRHVVIVDDVMTTGATVDALAHLLRRAGVERIDAWTIARTP